MNCCDVGIPSPHTAGQVAKHKEVPTGVPVYLPTGVINSIPILGPDKEEFPNNERFRKKNSYDK